MTKIPKVSIVCITYNQELYIAETLDGFVKQDVDFDIEIVVADDGSKDNTPEIIRSYAKKYPTLFKPILRKKNLGAIPNFLDALSRTRGAYIALCEGDDYWTDPLKLRKQVYFMEQHPKCSVSFHKVWVTFQDSEHKDYIFPDVEDKTWYTNEELLKTNYIPTNSVMYKRLSYNSLPSDVMPFDWFLHLYHANFGQVLIIDEVMSVYRKHQAGIWWDYDQNRDNIWRHYGLSYVALLLALEKVYADNKRALGIIGTTLYGFLGDIIEIDNKYNDRLFPGALKLVGDRQTDFMVDQQIRLSQKEDEIKNLTTQLLEVGDERQSLLIKLSSLEKELSSLEKEINSMRNSKIWKMHLAAVKVKLKFH